MGNHRHAGFAVIQAGNGGEIFSTVMVKDFGIFAGDFFQRFETIGGKARGDDREIFHTAFGERLHGHVGIGLQPFGHAEARLEGEHEFVGAKPEPFAEQPRGLVTLTIVGITLDEIVLRDAVE